MTDEEKFDIEEFWLRALRQLWIVSTEHVPDDMDAQLRGLFEEYPPIKTEATWNVAPMVYGLARKIGRDPDELLAEFTAGQQRDRDERADAVEAAEELLRGD